MVSVRRGFLFITFLIVLAGCSHNVPLRQSMMLTDPPEPKMDKKILVVIPKEQAELIIRHKPDPLADTYVFAGGPALKNTLVSVLNQVFQEVGFAHSAEGAAFDYDYAVAVNFRSHTVKLNIYTGNVVTLGVDYTVKDKKGKELLSLPTDVSSKDRYSGGELAGALLGGAFANISKMKQSSGAAWDQATVNTIGMFLDKLLILVKES